MIPRSFEHYIARREAELPHELQKRNGADKCTCCGRKGRRLAGGGYCRDCLRDSWQYDLGEAAAVEALLGGAVAAALGASVYPELIRRTVDEAIDAYHEECAESMLRGVMKATA